MPAQVEPGSEVKIELTVMSGRGKARAHVERDSLALAAILGQDVYPGSLNTVARQPIRLRQALATSFDGGRRMTWPAILNGRRVLVYRWSMTPLHVFELLCDVRLRDSLKLVDGQVVELSIEKRYIEDMGRFESLWWSLLWSGREGWYYQHRQHRFFLLATEHLLRRWLVQHR